MDTPVFMRCLLSCLEIDLGDGLPEVLALGLGDVYLEFGRSTRAVSTSEGPGTPRRATMDLGQVGQEREGWLVPKRKEEDSVVGQRRQSGVDSHFLSSTRGTSGNEDTGVLATEGTLGPEPTGSIPEGLPLSGERTVTSGDAEEEGIIFGEIVGDKDREVRLGRGTHLGQNLLRESLRDLEDFGGTTSGLDTSLDAIGELGDMTVESVDDDGNPWRRHCVFSEVMIADAGESVWDERISFYLYGSPWGWIA